MKTHYAYIESQANESYNETEWSEPICGTQLQNTDLIVSDDWNFVDCKKCLKRKEAHLRERKQHMEDNIKDMAGFVEFMEKENTQAVRPFSV